MVRTMERLGLLRPRPVQASSQTIFGQVVEPGRGAIIVGDADPKWTVKAIGAVGTVPTSDGTDLAYAHPNSRAWPIGSVFVSVVSTNPATLLGIGTWSAIGAGRVLVGVDSGDSDFDTAEKTGGAKTVAAAGSNAAENAHTHAVTQSAFGTDLMQTLPVTGEGVYISGGIVTTPSGAGSSHNHAFTGSPTSVVQPFLCVYLWKRTA